MSRRSRAAYWSQLERPIAWCRAAGCRNKGARWSDKDGQALCKGCRATLRAEKKTKPAVEITA